MGERLFSINNSSESLEKSIGIIYTNLMCNYDFYSQYDINVFYGDNLPKTNAELSVAGTIGFYEKYMHDCKFSVAFNINDLWAERIKLLSELVSRGIISSRNAEKMKDSFELFSKVISLIPVSYIYPQFYLTLLKSIKLLFSNVSFKHMNLFDDCEYILDSIGDNYSLYKIYALQVNGEIGVFNFELPNNDHYERSRTHLIRSISKSLSLSGNSAVLLAQIGKSIGDANGVLGYRNHKYCRLSRQVAINELIMKFPNTIIEPKNVLYNGYFDKYNDIINNEERANEVAASAFHDFVKSNELSLKL